MKSHVHALAAAVVLASVLRGCVVQGFKVPAGSMLPTLQVGDHILVSRIAYGVPAPFSGRWLWHHSSPAVGDVVVLERREEPDSYFVKRVVAVAGEIVETVDGQLIVDGHPRTLPASQFSTSDKRDFRPLRVPPGTVFVLGDNREESIDSRNWGPVETAGIKGRVFLIYWSQRKSGGSVRWERLAAWIR